MQTIEIQKGIRVGFDDLARSFSKMETPDLEQFQRQISHLLAKRRAKILSKRETELLLKINEGLPPELKMRYEKLSAKKKPLGSTDLEELSRLIDQIELKDAQRLESLMELASLRKVRLDDLMLQLGLAKPAHA